MMQRFSKVLNWSTNTTSYTPRTVCFTPSGASTTSAFTSSFMVAG
jgi:hypothetical protein